MNKLQFLTSNNLVNLSNSILKHFNVPPFHESIEDIDKLLANHHKVVILLFDGLGHDILLKHLKEDSFIRSHYFKTISSVYPPTTVAATNAFLSGRYPLENGWLGWSQYFKEYNTNINVFKNTDFDTDKLVKESVPLINDIYCHYDNIVSLINQYNEGHIAEEIFIKGIKEDGPRSLYSSYQWINHYLKNKDKAFIYFYWPYPDSLMHKYGVSHKKVNRYIAKIDKFIKKVILKNKDTLFLSIADHGLINIKSIDLCLNKALCSTFLRLPTLEARTTTFFIKEDKKEEFEKIFKRDYGDKFILLNKEEVYKFNVFGKGTPHPNIDMFIGDYVSIAIKEYAFNLHSYIQKKNETFVAAHAGYTEEELLIDVSAYNN